MYSPKDPQFERNGGTPSSDSARDADHDAGADRLEALSAALRSDARQILRSLKRAWFVESRRFGLRAIDAFFRGALYICLLGFGLTASIAAALLVVSGICKGIQTWSGANWAGDLGGGLLVLAVIVGSGLAVRAHLRQELLRSTKRALAAPASAQRREARP